MRIRSGLCRTGMAGALALVLVLAGIAGSTLAAGNGPDGASRGPRMGARGARGPQFRTSAEERGAEPLVSRVAAILDMKVEEVATARHAGKSLVEIAKEKGVGEEQLLDNLIAEARTRVDDLVSQGKMTRDQADNALENIRENLRQALNRTATGPQGAAPKRNIDRDGLRAAGDVFGRGARAGFGVGGGSRTGLRQGMRRGLRAGASGPCPENCPLCPRNQNQGDDQSQNPDQGN